MAQHNAFKNFNFNDLTVSDAYEVKFLPIDALKDSKENAERTADFKARPDDVESFKDQLEMIGLLDPLHVVDLGDERYKVISGHYRKYCLEQLFKEGRTVTYKGRTLNNEVPCIIDDIKDKDQMVISLIAANSRNNSVNEKIYRTKMAVETHEKLLKQGADVTPNRNEYVAMLTGYSVRSVQSYINQINGKTTKTDKPTETKASNFDLAKTTKKAKTLADVLDKELDDEDVLQERLASYTDTQLIEFINELNGVIDSLKAICAYAENIAAHKQRS